MTKLSIFARKENSGLLTECVVKSFFLTEKKDAFRGGEEAGREDCPMPQCFLRGEDPFEKTTSFTGKLGK